MGRSNSLVFYCARSMCVLWGSCGQIIDEHGQTNRSFKDMPFKMNLLCNFTGWDSQWEAETRYVVLEHDCRTGLVSGNPGVLISDPSRLPRNQMKSFWVTLDRTNHTLQSTITNKHVQTEKLTGVHQSACLSSHVKVTWSFGRFMYRSVCGHIQVLCSIVRVIQASS